MATRPNLMVCDILSLRLLGEDMERARALSMRGCVRTGKENELKAERPPVQRMHVGAQGRKGDERGPGGERPAR